MTGNYGEPPAAQPIVVAALKEGLSAVGDTAHVGTRIPRTRPDRLIRISRIGGGGEFGVDTALILVECWDPSEANAERLAHRADRILHQARGHTYVGGFVTGWNKTSGPVSFEDPDTANPRFQLIGELVLLIG